MDAHMEKPCLRPVEAFPVQEETEDWIGLYDRTGLSPVCLTLSPAALVLLTMMDGTHDREQMRQGFLHQTGQMVSPDTVDRLIHHLEQAHLLEGPGFAACYRTLTAAYRAEGVRTMPNAAALGIVDADGEPFRAILAEAESDAPEGEPVGIVAPHLDYPRGKPCYAAAYAALLRRRVPRRVIILGTNHFGQASAVVATGNDFATPLGLTRCDTDFLTRLEDRVGPLRVYELDHRREHSIELQVGFLQHIFGPDSFAIVPLLCPDPCGPTGTAPYDGHGADLRTFATALRTLILEDGADTLLVAGADMSHVGTEFGDSGVLDDGFLADVRRHDLAVLEAIEQGDAEALLAEVTRHDNATRMCSVGCMFVLATVLAGRKVQVLGYHQAVREAGDCCVTCAAVVYT